MRRHLLSIIAILVLPAYLPAQTGLPPFASIDQIGLEYRNNQDLNVLVAVPVISSPGRGGLNLNFSLVYNSSIWANAGTVWTPNPNNVAWGWTTAFNTGYTTYQYSTRQSVCNRHLGDVTYIYTWTYQNYVYTDALGTTHKLPLFWQEVENDCQQTDTTTGTFSGYATDGSGFLSSISVYDPTTVKIITRGGISLSPASITDTNGNYISSTINGSETDWTDSAGRLALKITTSTSSVTYQYPDPNNAGQFKTTTLNLQPQNIKTNFGCTGVIEFNESSVYLPSSLVLPNNQTYTFTYEQTPGNSGYTTGRLQRITLPTTGYYEYDYPGANDSVNCADGTTLSINRVVNDGTGSATWNYVRNTSNLTTTITTPQLADTPNANDMKIVFNSSGQETSRVIYKESPGVTAWRTINTSWAANGTPATKTTILEDGNTQSQVATTYDSNGLLDSVSEYDWGPGAHGSLLRTTTFAYQSSTNYTNLNILNLVTSKQIKDVNGTVQYRQDITYDGVALQSANCPTGALQHGDSGFPCTFNYRGNPTQVTTYLQPASQGTPISKNFTYDWFGNLLTAQVNCCQNKTWTYSATTQYSLPDSVQSGSSASLTTSFQYNAYTGQVTSSTDANSLATNISYDSLRRPIQIIQKVGGTQIGGTASYTYDDTNFKVTSTATINSTPNSVQQITSLDKLARPYLSTTEDINSNVISNVTAQYDLAGRAYKTSTPYTGSPSAWTTTAFDVLGRPTSVTAPDSSVSSVTYTTNTSTTSDPASVQRKSQMDAVGRLSSVWEPDPSNNNTLTLQTSYVYNVLDELTQTTQGSQTRSYAYDALGRITSATTPEAGTVCFGTVSGGSCQFNSGYDSYDNLKYRTDARGVVTSYGYDALNRLTSVSYNVGGTTATATSSLGFTYGLDSSCNSAHGAGCIGQLITMTDGVGSENYTYNNLEQLTQLAKVINGTTYNTSYAYNLAAELSQITYPSGRVVQQAVDAIGRLCAVATSATNCTTLTSPFASGLAYSASGQLTDLKYGNGVYASYGYNANLQLSCLDYSTTSRNGTCTHDGTTKFGLTYSYPAAPGNNGLISSISDYVDSGRNASYTYDALYRLVTAATPGSANYPAWGLQEYYDRYGNRYQQKAISGCVAPMTCPQPNVGISTTSNRLTGSPYAYDSSGNMTDDGINTLAYDAENDVTSASNGSSAGAYIYDGKSHRVQKCLPSCGGSNPNTVYIFWRSKVIAEYDNGAAAGSPSREYIYSGATLLAKIDSSGTKYYQQDHLSNRLITDSSGNTVGQQGHFPYGEQWYPVPPASPTTKWEFTTYERDSESGNDYAQARYNVNGLARFSSPDRMAGSSSDPQSLNRYSYVRNMPVMLTDPFGTCPAVAENRDSDQPQDSKAGGPSATASSEEADADPQGPGGNNQSCPGTAPWYYTIGGGGGDGALGGGFGGGGVSIDGGETFDPGDGGGGLLGNSESTVQCPNSMCSGGRLTAVGWQYVQFSAFEGPAAAADGYFTTWGVGSLAFSTDEAGIAAARWGIWYESQTGSEVGGSLWCAGGVCSSTVQAAGQSNAGSFFLQGDFQDIPDGTNPAGWWRVTSGDSPSSDLNAVDALNGLNNTNYPLYSGDFGDPGAPVLFYKKGFNSSYECVLAGPVPSSGIAGACPSH
jgi:RHS repeat-associated protein